MKSIEDVYRKMYLKEQEIVLPVTKISKVFKKTQPKSEPKKSQPPTKTEYDKIPTLNIPDDIMKRVETFGTFGSPEQMSPADRDVAVAQHEIDMQNDAKLAEDMENEKRKYDDFNHSHSSGLGGSRIVKYRHLLKKKKSMLPWTTILGDFIKIPERTDRDYRKPSQRFEDFLGDEIFMPGYSGLKLQELAFFIDISGSMPDGALRPIFREVGAITEKPIFGKNSIIRSICFGEVVSDEHIFTNKPKIKYKSVKQPGTFVPPEKIIPLPFNQNYLNQITFRREGTGTERVVNAFEQVRKYDPFKPKLAIIITDADYEQSEFQRLANYRSPFKLVWLITKKYRNEEQLKQVLHGSVFFLQDYNYDISDMGYV